MKHLKGFTFVELVAVVLILGILAVSVYPSISSSGYSGVTDQQQVISLLRNVQSRAMQNTQDGQCQGVYFTSSNIGLASQANDGTCNSAFDVATSDINNNFRVELENSYTVSPALSILEFDDWGRPTVGNNLVTVTITIDGTYTVTIEPQGYVHD
ncbi:MAG: prepilin-type N-terminal cleavage/methylation domain-containing protein [Gammaproteobacteria bacterium]|nr:prepilin-type N-terminal cleavage/methylation domain-containing protein [Gammaproteobacteria bacterium]